MRSISSCRSNTRNAVVVFPCAGRSITSKGQNPVHEFLDTCSGRSYIEKGGVHNRRGGKVRGQATIHSARMVSTWSHQCGQACDRARRFQRMGNLARGVRAISQPRFIAQKILTRLPGCVVLERGVDNAAAFPRPYGQTIIDDSRTGHRAGIGCPQDRVRQACTVCRPKRPTARVAGVVNGVLIHRPP